MKLCLLSTWGQHPDVSLALPELTDEHMISQYQGILVKLHSSIHIKSNSENILLVSD